jgi:starvation-inducible outer membrane lipoprotein
MILNPHLSIKIVINPISIVLIGCISIPPAIAQSTSPSPEIPPPQPTPEQPQQNGYIGFGGVIGIQGRTTSLSQGTFSMLSKHVLTINSIRECPDGEISGRNGRYTTYRHYNQRLKNDIHS